VLRDRRLKRHGAPDKFLYVFKTGPSRARKRAATTGRDACPPLRFAAFWARPLAWRARANRVPESKTAELAITDRRPVDVLLAEAAGYPTPAVAACSRLIVGYRIAPLAIMEKCGPARHASRAPPASQAIEQARPVTRTDPNLRSAAIGAMRRTGRGA
jgi:hypothetical protein